MKLLAIFAAALLAVHASTDKDQWVAFKHTHGKTYKSMLEERTRFGIFQSNLRKIEEHNAKYDSGEKTYFLGVTPFADMTHEEFKAMLKRQVKNKPELNATRVVFPENLEVPESIDWVEKQAVVDVKDQEQCGSCWAFSATGALEGQNAIINHISTPLSEQQLLDCSEEYGNGNCYQGGNMIFAFLYVRDKGIQSESKYPYKGIKSSCEYNPDQTVLKIKGYKQVTATEDELKKAVGTIGPISVAIYADGLQLYQGGIFDDPFCSHDLDHGALVVGYDESPGLIFHTKYWKVKNSWGKSWGEEGYFRIKRDAKSMCGIADQPSYPILN